MPKWLKRIMFSVLGPMVRIKYVPSNTKSRKHLIVEENCELTQNSESPYSAPIEMRTMNILNETLCEGNGCCNQDGQPSPIQRTRSRKRSIRETPILNDHVDKQQGKYLFDPVDELGDDETINNNKDWQMAAKILDRVVLILGILISFATFLCIFLQAPRVREMFWWNSWSKTWEKRKRVGNPPTVSV